MDNRFGPKHRHLLQEGTGAPVRRPVHERLGQKSYGQSPPGFANLNRIDAYLQGKSTSDQRPVQRMQPQPHSSQQMNRSNSPFPFLNVKMKKGVSNILKIRNERKRQVSTVGPVRSYAHMTGYRSSVPSGLKVHDLRQLMENRRKLQEQEVAQLELKEKTVYHAKKEDDKIPQRIKTETSSNSAQGFEKADDDDSVVTLIAGGISRKKVKPPCITIHEDASNSSSDSTSSGSDDDDSSSGSKSDHVALSTPESRRKTSHILKPQDNDAVRVDERRKNNQTGNLTTALLKKDKKEPKSMEEILENSSYKPKIRHNPLAETVKVSFLPKGKYSAVSSTTIRDRPVDSYKKESHQLKDLKARLVDMKPLMIKDNCNWRLEDV